MIQRWKQRGNHLATARLAVQRDLTWPARLLRLGILVLVVGGLTYAGYHYGLTVQQREAAQSAGVPGADLAQEVGVLRQKLSGAEQQLRVEVSTRETLSRQLQQYQIDNGALKERLAFFESLLTRTDRVPGLAIDTFRAEPLSPGRYRLKLVLIQGQSSREAFMGELDFKLTSERAGKRLSAVWPAQRLALRVDRFGMVETDVNLPEDARLRQVEVRVYGKDGRAAQLSRSYDVKG